MNHSISCIKCNSDQLSLQKKGYDIKQASISFIAIAILLSFIWTLAIQNENAQNTADKMMNMSHYDELMGKTTRNTIAYENDSLLWGGTGFILALSLLVGFIGSNDNQKVCLNCGNIMQFNYGTEDEIKTMVTTGEKEKTSSI